MKRKRRRKQEGDEGEVDRGRSRRKTLAAVLKSLDHLVPSQSVYLSGGTV